MNAAFGVVDTLLDVEIVRGDTWPGYCTVGRLQRRRGPLRRLVTRMAQAPDAVEVTFERAVPRSFHLVIGAYGLHSKVRALAFGPESRFGRHLGRSLSFFTVPTTWDSITGS